MDRFMLHHGDCLDVMRGMEACSVDSIVTDPPYGLSFMGKDWDHGIPGKPFWEQALRVAKPGAHLLAFGGTRTFHRLVCAIEDAGWEIRDTVMWVYGSGFPKSLDVGKALDKVAPSTEAAKQWDGWGTALKPAYEPIILARKPLTGMVAANVLEHGVGGLNVGACRVGVDVLPGQYAGQAKVGTFERGDMYTPERQGRYPSNLILDGSPEVVALFPVTTSGFMKAGTPYPGGNVYGAPSGSTKADTIGDSGSAARFFYCAKADGKDRDEGLDTFTVQNADPYGQHRGRRMEDNDERFDGKPAKQGRNHHPTVKPVSLMQYLCRLITPPDGIILDPFMGSGSTGKAAMLEKFRFVGIEQDAEYLEIARARISSVGRAKLRKAAMELPDGKKVVAVQGSLMF